MEQRKLAALLYSWYGGKRSTQREGFTSGDTSSMGDVAFLLLIFFIVTTSFILRQGVFFTLPAKSEGAQRIEEKDLIKVYPEKAGYTYNQQKVTDEQMAEQIQSRMEENSDPVVLIYMDDELDYSRLVETLSLVKQTGIKRVSVKNRGEDGA